MSYSDLFLFEWFGSLGGGWGCDVRVVNTCAGHNDILKIDSNMTHRVIQSTMTNDMCWGGLSRLWWIFHLCRWGLREDHPPHSWQDGKINVICIHVLLHIICLTFTNIFIQILIPSETISPGFYLSFLTFDLIKIFLRFVVIIIRERFKKNSKKN